MRTGTAFSLLALLWAVPVWAQQSDSDASVGRIRRALETVPPPITLSSPLPPVVSEPGVKRFGVFTLTPPQTRGEIVSVNVPVGELVMRAVDGVANAHHRRAERRAHEEVLRALADFKAQHP